MEYTIQRDPIFRSAKLKKTCSDVSRISKGGFNEGKTLWKRGPRGEGQSARSGTSPWREHRLSHLPAVCSTVLTAAKYNVYALI